MVDQLKKIKEPVAGEFQCFVDEYTGSLQSHSTYLKSAIDVVFSSNGKHVRPLLVLLAAKACGNITPDSVNAAVLLELLHTATLLHDDVVDDTKVRRGQPTLNAVFDNRISVLVGDFVLSTALLRSIGTGDIRMIKIISQLGRDLSEGEIEQLETAENHLINEESYWQVIKKKTATLLAACTEMGAISSGVSDEMIALCREIGENLGFCFQLRDDVFDYFESHKIGKPTGNDIREGKVTLPLLYALKTADLTISAPFHRIIDEADFTDENIDSLICFAKEYGGIVYTEKYMQIYRERAIQLIMQLPDSTARQSLLMLADYIIERNK